MTAALLYAGAAAVGLFSRSDVSTEAALSRGDLPRLSLMALFGAMLGPAALAWGLQHTNGVSASLMLTLEAVFTVVLSGVFYREQVDRRIGVAIGLLTVGGALLVVDRSGRGTPQLVGLLAVLAATICWGFDNTLSRALAHLDPSQVVLGKASLGAAFSLIAAFVVHQYSITLGKGLGLALIGGLGYGLSLRLYLLAQRAFGAARTGSVFASAHFVGAAVAFGMGQRNLTFWTLGGSALMIAGVLLHISEQHEHEHVHEAMEHEHAHTHDDGHHTHMHHPMPTGPHSHWHRHEPMVHPHPHVPDLHHTHAH
jgi:drug/metabolite transporter (DMT)-like permease